MNPHQKVRVFYTKRMASILRNLSVGVALFLAWPAFSAEWGVVGAGNATCEHWGRANPTTKEVITSWMEGFATSENLSRAAVGSRELQLEFLTSEYLKVQIEAVCSASQKKNESISGIIIGILSKLPTR